jgi:hypothetical protein
MGFPRWGRFTNDKLSPSGKFRTRNAILRIADKQQQPNLGGEFRSPEGT